MTDEVIQTQRTSHKQTIQQNFTVNGRTTTQNRRGDSRIARQTNDLTETNGKPMVAHGGIVRFAETIKQTVIVYLMVKY